MYYPPSILESHFGPFLIRMDGLVYAYEGKWQDIQLLQFVGVDSKGEDIYEEDLIYYENHGLWGRSPDKHFGTIRYHEKRAQFLVRDLFETHADSSPRTTDLGDLFCFDIIRNIEVLGSTFEPINKVRYDELKAAQLQHYAITEAKEAFDTT